MGDEIVDLSYSGWEPVTDAQLDVVRQRNRAKNAEIVQLRADLRDCRARLAELVLAEEFGGFERITQAVKAAQAYLAAHPEAGNG